MAHRPYFLRFAPAFCVALLLTFAASGASAQPASSAATADSTEAEHALWRVTSDAGTIHLMGSVHLLTEDAYPLAPTMQAAIEQAERVAFEVNLDSMQAMVPRMVQVGMYQSDSTLQQAVSDSTYALLKSAVDTLQIPMAQMNRMRPWFASLTLTSVMLQRSGYKTSLGLDMHVYRKAQERELEVVGLETVEEQLSVLSSASSSDPDAYLRYTLENLDESMDQIDRIMSAWKSGDVEAVASVMNEGMDAFPQMREQLLIQRNRNWIPGIEALMSGPENTLVVVGTGHLVGEGSVVEMLKQNGHTVTQL
jgi:uncharacterized protein